jgi:AcrR family transcriptional regulator
VSRAKPVGRIQQLIDAATDVFITAGYARAQMEDVARAVGIAKGTLYGYVESKAALFDAAVRCADGHEPLPDAGVLPLRTPRAGSTVASVQARLLKEVSDLELLAALGREPSASARLELEAIVSDLYLRMSRNRRGIKLVDRCAQDQPELAAVWFGQGRWGQHMALVQYLEQCAINGRLRPLPSTHVAARLVLETIAFWAVHRHWDPAPREIAEEDVQATVVDMLVHALLKEPP